MTWPLRWLEWQPAYRIIASRFPPVGLFDRVSRPEHLDAVFELESMTNPRLRQEAGEIFLVAPEDRVTGEGTTPIMAAFTHLNPNGSRFSDGSFGVYYCARAVDTAIRETVYHTERFLGDHKEAPIDVGMRLYRGDLAAELHDLRGLNRDDLVLDPDSYAASQSLGVTLRRQQSNGVAYPSVRHHGGECAGVFRPNALQPVKQSTHYSYRWDGGRITHVFEKRSTNLDLGL